VADKHTLVIVESPAKARTIAKYLGDGYEVLASVGHVRDLPKSKLGVDVDQDFQPEYVTIRGKKDVLDRLKKAAKDSGAVYLATDPDREGEAIAWHVMEYLDVKDKPVFRATFNEITKSAIQKAIENPGQIDQNLFMAQQARRIMDRLVGYKISPLLWDKVQRGLSAGRVQSVAVRLLVEREKEIEAFVAEEYWTIDADVEGKNPPPFVLRLSKIEGKKARVPDEENTKRILAETEGQSFVVRAVTKKPTRRNPQPPFITSTMQQEAARKLRFSPNQTMRVAQGLYEGISLGDEGPVGLITYMRTDSTRVSESAVEGAREFVKGKYGERYVPEKPRTFTSRRGAQDAHEAVRPTLLDHPPERLASYLDANQMALYKLVWDRFIASQMAAAELEQTTIEVPVQGEKYLFTASGSVMTFSGFLALYEEGREQDEEDEDEVRSRGKRLPQVESGEELKVRRFLPEQHFTQPSSRFSMSSLIRELERRGIGRPSTYAAILSTIMDKKYAERVEGYFRPTDLGRMVTDLLVESFPEILDIKFTAHMEEELDEVEEGKMEWLNVLREFYRSFSERLEQAEISMRSPKTEEVETDVECNLCGSKMVLKWGRNGHFLACSNYPECKNTKPYARDEEGNVVAEEVPQTEEKCDKCGGEMVVKSGRHGQFLACSSYPDCKNTRPIAEIQDGKAVAEEAPPDTDEKCDLCGAEMAVKSGRRGRFLACTDYPKCRGTKNIAEVKDGKAIAVEMPKVEEVCDKCGAPMQVKTGRRGPFLACSAYPKCKNAKPLPEDHPAAQEIKGQAAARPKPIETEEKCENCGKPMVLRDGRHGPFLGCSGYPQCKTIQKATPDILEKYQRTEEESD